MSAVPAAATPRAVCPAVSRYFTGSLWFLVFVSGPSSETVWESSDRGWGS